MTHFPCCQQLASEYDNIYFTCFEEIIDLITDDFSNRFTDFEALKSDMELYTGPMKPAIYTYFCLLQQDCRFQIHHCIRECACICLWDLRTAVYDVYDMHCRRKCHLLHNLRNRYQNDFLDNKK